MAGNVNNEKQRLYSKDILQSLHKGKISLDEAKKQIENRLNVLNCIEKPKEASDYKESGVKPANVLNSDDKLKSQSVTDKTVEKGNRKERSIAIIGMSGQFPKARNPAQFWENLSQGKDCISEIPSERWNMEEYYDPDPNVPGKSYCKFMGVLEDVDKFDPLFFSISPAEAELMDPQHRLFLENCWRCIEDSGITPNLISGSRCGVFVGCGAGDYGQSAGKDDLNAQGLLGASPSILAARISYLLNLKGPCLAIDTACSSSLVAISEACNSLILDTCDMALAGGVYALFGPSGHIMASKAGMLSKDGRCFTFDARANGYVPGEGVGVILLKRLEDAISDEDTIYGIIRGWGVNQDGKTNGITAPSVNSQVALEKEVYQRFGIDPGTITMVEAHGTGTKLGDPIEVEALIESFRAFTDKTNYCALGSAKSNIGHLVKSAGIAGVIKILLAMKHKMLPPTINFEKLNEHISLDNSPFYINTGLRDWVTAEGEPRRACISAFGFSGTNSHLVIEEYIPCAGKSKADEAMGDNGPSLFVLSAKNQERLKAYAESMRNFIATEKNTNLKDFLYTLQIGREAMDYRLAFSADSREGIIEKLDEFISGKQREDVFSGQIKKGKEKAALQGEDIKTRLKTCIQNKNWQGIADLWVKGLRIDWGRLYRGTKPLRINIPTYPFNNETYWISSSETAGGTKNSRMYEAKEQLHPLINENTSDFNEQRYSTTFTGSEFFLTDHKIKGKKVLPGVAYLEMAREAVNRSVGASQTGEKIIKLKNVVWIRPMLVEEPVRVHIGLYPGDNGDIAYEIYGLPENGDVSGQIIYNQGNARLDPVENIPMLDLKALKSRCSQRELSGSYCYDTFERLGISYGVGHKGIEKVYTGQGQVLAKLSLPDTVLKTSDSFVLHPALMDSALQATIGLMDGQEQNKPVLPFVLQELEVFGPCSDSLWAFIRESESEKAYVEGSTKRLDIDLCDTQGKVCVRMKGLLSRTFEDESSLSEKSQTLILQSGWKENPTAGVKDTEPIEMTYGQHCIILCDFDRDSSSNTGSKVSEAFNSSRCIELQLKERNIAKWLEYYVLKVFEEIQRVLLEKPRKKILMQVVVPDNGESRLLSSLGALLKTAHLENSKVIGQLIEVDRNDGQWLIERLRESGANPSANHIRYRDGKRWVIDWKEVETGLEPHTPWKDGGIYLITGGAGALGLIFAKEIAGRAKNCTLILVGRSEPDKEKLHPVTDALKELDAMGARTQYIQVDIGKKRQVEDLIEGIRERFGDLNGIIHCAGIIRDNFIHKKSSSEIEAVLEPKVAGLVNLDQATSEMPLDFILCCSSGAGAFGNVGQADYAAANAFMDAFSEYRNELVNLNRRRGLTLSVNWPLWKNGGMRIDAETQKLMTQSTGMVAMETQSGINALYVGIASKKSRVAVMQGDINRIRQKLFPLTVPTPIKSTKRTSVPDPGSETARLTALKEKVLRDLIQMVSAQLKVKIENIDADNELRDYGFDSISFTAFANTINKEYSLDLTPTVFFENQTLQSLTEYLVEEHMETLFAKFKVTSEKDYREAEQYENVETGQASDELPGRVQAALKQMVSKQLKVKVEDIDGEGELGDYGFDSISLTAFANNINRQYDLELTPAIFFEYSTLNSLAEYLLSEHKAVFEGRYAEPSVKKADGDPVKIDIKAASGIVKRQKVRFAGRESAEISRSDAKSPEPVAIVGISGRFPKAKNIKEYWQNLYEGTDCISEIPKDRWDWQEYYGDPNKESNKTDIKWGGFIDGIDEFDPLFFGISPREAQLMDPQQRLLMMYAWSAIEDAGYSAESLAGTKTAIFAGTAMSGYNDLISKANIPIEGYSATGVAPSIGPNRMSYFLNIHGPSEPIETACSSSLVAIHRAVSCIESGQSEMALAGGVNTILLPDTYISFSKAGMLSKDGRCKTFSNKANGYVRGEGVGFVFLKKLSAAERDGDYIYGIIRGSAENHGGRANSLTAPNPKAQAELLVAAYKKAGIDPRTVTYIEAHGTGTELGDPIEINAMKAAFKELYKDAESNTPEIGKDTISRCGIGSVKTNIGHLELAAGIAGVIKVLLQLKHKTLVKTLHCDVINPYIQLKDSPFYIQQETKPWEALKDEKGRDIPRRAGVSSFGFGGVNAHVVIEEYIPENSGQAQALKPPDGSKPTQEAAVVLSAKNEEQLKDCARNLLAAVREGQFTDNSLADIAYTLQVGRDAMEERMGFVVCSIRELEEKLNAILSGKADLEGIYKGRIKQNKETVSLFMTDEDLQKAVDAWINKRKYTKLLDMWVKGLVVDWSKLYRSPKRIQLPTYPFAKESYWVREAEGNVSHGGRETSATAMLHPLLHRNISDFSEQRFSSTFTGEEFFLKHHVVRGKQVLPGVAYLEMAYEAIIRSIGLQKGELMPVRIKNAVWERPFVINGQPEELNIGLICEDNGEIAYKIYGVKDGSGAKGEDDAGAYVYSRGSAVLDVIEEGLKLDITDIKAQCNEKVLSGPECYVAFKEAGLEYGDSFRGIAEVYVGNNQALAKLIMPDAVNKTLERFVLHPSLMDSALQASIGLFTTVEKQKPLLPFALQELEVLRSCSSIMWANVRYSNNPVNGKSQGKTALTKIDMDLCDEQGNICVRMRGLSSRELESGTEFTAPNPATEVMLLGTVSKELPLEHGRQTESPVIGQHIVILCEIPAVNEITGGGMTGAASSTKYIELHSRQEGIAERFQDYGIQVFEEIQGVIRGKLKEQVLIQVVVPSIGEKGLFAGLDAVLKTAEAENPKIKGQLIETDCTDKAEILEKINESSSYPMYNHISYRDGRAFISDWEELKDIPVSMPWKDKGVYLITGGAGGLGFIFAKEIARNARDATLILAGRSACDTEKYPERALRIEELEAAGAKVRYVQADITEKKEVEGLIDGILKDYRKIDGIIHAAGVVRDNFIIKKTREEVESVLAPKVKGVVNLDAATAKLPLDIFILFSSAAGNIANPGQADYAMANAFMDLYAEYRNKLADLDQRSGRTVSIDWPLWKEGGMHIDAEMERLMTQRTGRAALNTDKGIRALYQCLASGKDRVMVLSGDIMRLKESLFDKKPSVADEKIHVKNDVNKEAGKPAVSINQDDIEEKTILFLKNLLSSAVRLPVERIDADAQLEKYGIDSFLIIQLTGELEKTFGSLSKTLFFEYQSIYEIAGYFMENHREKLIGIFEPVEVEAEAVKNEAEPVKSAALSRDSARFTDKIPTRFNRMGSVQMPVKPVQEKELEALDVAIIGVAGRYPGAEDVQEFWRNLSGGKDCISEIPDERWDHSLYYDEEKGKPNKTYSKWGGFIKGVDQFDPMFFNISPREARLMEPQERLFLQCVYETLEDAGYTREGLDRNKVFGLENNVGVYVGVMYEEYQLYAAQSLLQGKPLPLGCVPASIANRVSYFCNFHGPSMALDTMCSSSLTAIHLACRSLKTGECKLAVAGGVNISIHPNKYLMLGQGNFISSKGRCESFGEGGDGYVPGEGVGAVLLKPLSEAIADGDHIYGVIKATALNHGGKTNGFTVPNPNAQSSVIGHALKNAGINPRTISYIEAHGTGTSLGDPIEITGLSKVFKEYTNEVQFCAIGSVKSNIGHGESAAGIAGVTKVLMQMKNEQLAPSLHSKRLNSNIDFSKTPFVVQQTLTEWKRPIVDIDGEKTECPRRAGISAFGAGGSNAHVIIEEYVPDSKKPVSEGSDSSTGKVIVLSARKPERLKERVQRLLEAVAEGRYTDSDLDKIAYTLQTGREAMEERMGFVVRSLGELKEKLAALAAGHKNVNESYYGNSKEYAEITASYPGREGLKREITKWIQHKEYGRILELWVKGLEFDWNELYIGEKPQRISLPTYPFAKESYWAPEQNRKTYVKTDLAETKGHSVLEEVRPVLHQKEIRTVVSAKPAGISLSVPNEQIMPARPIEKAKQEVKLTQHGVLPEISIALPVIPAVEIKNLPQNAEPPAVSIKSLREELTVSLAEALYMDKDEVEPDKNFIGMGLDSIVAVEWIKSVNNKYGVSIGATKVYDYPNIIEFAGLLAEELKEKLGYTNVNNTTVSEEKAIERPIENATAKAVEESAEKSEIQELSAVSIKLLLEELSESLAEALYMDKTDVEPDKSFIDMGLDSIVAVEWIKSVNNKYGVSIGATRVYDYPNIYEFAGFLAGKLKQKPVKYVETSGTLSRVTKITNTTAPVPSEEIKETANETNIVSTANAGSIANKTSVVNIESAVNEASVANTADIANSVNTASKKVLQTANERDVIAVVGISGRYPGAGNLDEYWKNLASGTNSVVEIPGSRWDINKYYDPKPGQPGKVYCRNLGALDDIEYFDPLFFNISPAEAENIDPQHRLFLQEGYRALEDAGYSPRNLNNRKCGVYLGIMNNDYGKLLSKNNSKAGNITGNSYSIAASRLSYFLNLKGPAIPIDTACSSSLVALHLASQALSNSEIDLALIGGVTLYLTPESYIGMCSAGMLSPDGQCKTFDDDANGFVPGEGVGAIVLKRLKDAEADHDHIYGVIIGSGINQDGKTNGITAPNVKSQIELERGIYEKFKIDPGSIGYVEMHGTGTKLGDPIELEALSTVIKEKTNRTNFCAIGSVKSNIGHTSAAAGVAGILKVLLCLKHKKLVPTLNFKTPNRHFDFENSPFYVNTGFRDWTALPDVPRRAGVSAFGFSGTNSHVVMEEYNQAETGLKRKSRQSNGNILFVLSAKEEKQLKIHAQNMKLWIESNGGFNMEDMAYTLQTGRDEMPYRLAFSADSREALLNALTGFIEGNAVKGIYTGELKRKKNYYLLLEEDEDTKILLQTYMEKCNLEKLAEFWVKGLEIDWDRLYAEKPYRISLPTYPFAKDVCWITVNTDSTDIKTGSGKANAQETDFMPAAVLHPLLHQNTSNLYEQRFSSTFDGHEFFLNDHRVKDRKVMPGAAYLEMVRAAVEEAAVITEESQNRVLLKNVVWTQPAVVGEQPISMHIRLLPDENGEIRYEVYSLPDGGGAGTAQEKSVIHCQGRAAVIPAENIPILDLKAVREECSKKTISSAQCYEAFRAAGLNYGRRHQAIEKLYVGEGQVLAKLLLPEDNNTDDGQFVLHPGVLDSALQAAIGFKLGEDGDENEKAAKGTLLPFALEELEIAGRCTSSMWALLRYQKSGEKVNRLQKLDVDLCDDKGNISVRMKGLSLKSAVEGTNQGIGDISTGTLMLEPVFTESVPVPDEASNVDYGKHLVILCEPEGITHQDMEACLKGISSQSTCIILRSDKKGINERYREYAAEVFEEIRNILMNKPKKKVLIQILVADHGETQVFAGLAGLLRTAALENPIITGQLIEINQIGDIEEIVRRVTGNIGEFAGSQKGVSHLRYMDGKRLVAGWREVEDSKRETAVPWKDGGVYLITGGTGGLGLIFAREIVSMVGNGTLILTGRSPLNSEKQEQLKKLNASGLKVVYRQADVAQKKDTGRLIRSIQEEYGGLNGIIHSAGIVCDNYILKKNRDEFERVLAPKVDGFINLDMATREMPLDFFILFSSIAGSLGNQGQADYSCANAFMDAYSAYRNRLVAAKVRKGYTLSINWPLWKEGGMHISMEMESKMTQNNGVVAMRTRTGINALYQSFATGKDRIMVYEGDMERMRRRLLLKEDSKATGQKTASAEKTPLQHSGTAERLVNYLKELIAGTLKIGMDRLDIHTSLERYGLDSIVVMSINNELEKHIPVLSKTLFFEYETIADLADYFMKAYKEYVIKLFPEPEPSNVKKEQMLLVEEVAPEYLQGDFEAASDEKRLYTQHKFRLHGDPVKYAEAPAAKAEVKANKMSLDEIINKLHVDIIYPDNEKQSEKPVQSYCKESVFETGIPILVHQDELAGNAWAAEIINEIDGKRPPVGYERTLYPYYFIASDRKMYVRLIIDNSNKLIIPFMGMDKSIYDELLDYSHKNDLQLLMVGGHSSWVDTRQTKLIPLGVWQDIDVVRFTLSGNRMRKLRYMVEKFKKSGEAEMLEYDSGSRLPLEEMRDIMIRWGESKKNIIRHSVLCMEELLSRTLTQGYRAFLTYHNKKLCSVIVIEQGENGMYVMDQEFYDPDAAPLGHMEYAISEIIEKLKEENARKFSLGLTWYPFVFEDHPQKDPEGWQWLKEQNNKQTLLKRIFQQAEPNYQFKKKFGVIGEPVFAYLPKDASFSLLLNYWPVFYQNSISAAQLVEKLKTMPLDNSGNPLSGGTNSGNKAQLKYNFPKQNLNREERRKLLDGIEKLENLDYGENPLDLMSDSWRLIKSAAVKNREAYLKNKVQLKYNFHYNCATPLEDAMKGRLESESNILSAPKQCDDVAEVIRSVFPFKHIILTEKGQVAEKLFYEAYSKEKKKILTAVPWTTTLLHQLNQGFEVIELPEPSVNQPQSTNLFKGEIDIKALQEELTKDADNVAMVGLEVLSNATGGHPVRLSHIKRLKGILKDYGIPLVLDATRIVRNAMLIKKYEDPYPKYDLWDIVRSISTQADHIVTSLTKDFAVPVGGLIATNDDKLAEDILNARNRLGLNLSCQDEMMIGAALEEKETIVELVGRQMKFTKNLGEMLAGARVPVLQPAYGHAVVIDVSQLSEGETNMQKKEAFLKKLFIETGIRGNVHQIGKQKNTVLDRCIRLAIPLGMPEADEQSIFNLLKLYIEGVGGKFNNEL